MKSFFSAIAVAVLVALGASIILGENQRTVDEAYATRSVRL